MKYKLLLTTLFFIALKTYAQQKNTISVVYGVSNTNVNIHDAVGDYGYEPETGFMYGITYSRAIAKFFMIQTGILYSDDKAEVNYIEPGIGTIYQSGEVKSISIPLTAKFTFLKYVYIDAGFSYDKETNYQGSSSVVNNQSGLGGEIGFGGRYIYKGIAVFVNPYFRQYNITVTNNNLYETGIKFGLGYNF